MPEEIAIIGGGPAGAAAAVALSKAGLRAAVYEAMDRLAVKPCGRAVPATSDLPLPIPRDVIIEPVRRAVLYVDGVKTVDVELSGAGYVVDKEELLEEWLALAGAEVHKSSRFNPFTGVVRAGGEPREVKGGLLAGGVAFYGDEKILAVQALARSEGLKGLDGLYIYFDTGLLGYYWVFPYGDSAEVGVGGYADFDALRRLLERFVEGNELTRGARMTDLSGAPIAVGGLDLGTLKGLAKVGEAAGFVLPLTGEGIRPSVISGYHAGAALAKGDDPISALSSLPVARAVRVQRSILEAVKRMSRERRREFLMAMPAEVHEEVALGSLRTGRILRALAGRPDLALKLIKYIGGGG